MSNELLGNVTITCQVIISQGYLPLRIDVFFVFVWLEATIIDQCVADNWLNGLNGGKIYAFVITCSLAH